VPAGLDRIAGLARRGVASVRSDGIATASRKALAKARSRLIR
jgi:hypothetical protein